MGQIVLNAQWVPGETALGLCLGGGREPDGTAQYVCRDRATLMIGKYFNGRAFFPLNHAEVARSDQFDLMPLHYREGPGAKSSGPAWNDWVPDAPRIGIAAMAMSYSVNTTSGSGSDAVSTTHESVAPACIARFAHLAGVHIGYAFLREGLLKTAYSYDGGVIYDETPTHFVAWSTSFDQIKSAEAHMHEMPKLHPA